MRRLKIPMKVISVALVLAMMLNIAAPALAVVPVNSGAARPALREMIAGYVDQQFEEGLYNVVEDYIVDFVTGYVDNALTDVNGLLNMVLSFSGTAGAELNPWLNSLLNDLINSLLESDIELPELPLEEYLIPILQKVVDKLFEFGIVQEIKSRTIQYAINDVMSLVVVGVGSESRENLIDKYTDDIFNINIPDGDVDVFGLFSFYGAVYPLAVTRAWNTEYGRFDNSASGITSKGAMTLHNTSRSAVNPFWNITKVTFTPTFLIIAPGNVTYTVSGWQNEVNAPLDAIPFVGDYLGGYTTIETYVNARLIADVGINAWGAISNYDAILEALPGIVIDSLKRATRDVITEYIYLYAEELEILIADGITDILDCAFDCVYGYDEIRNAIRLVPGNLQLKSTLEGIVEYLFDYAYNYLDTGNAGSFDLTCGSALDALKTMGLGIVNETARVIKLRLQYETLQAVYRAKVCLSAELNAIFNTNLTGDMSLAEMKEALSHTIDSIVYEGLQVEEIINALIRIRAASDFAETYSPLDLTEVNDFLDDLIACLNAKKPLHNEGDGVITKEAGCEDGVISYFCTICNMLLRTEAIPATGIHSHVALVTAPTCTADGFTTHTCSVCGDSYVDSETSALGHAWDGGVVTVAAACEEDGLMTYSCSRCSATKTEAIPAAGHSYLSVVTSPACTAGGYTTHTCSVCGDSYVDSETSALGHDWDGGVVTVAAACEEDGLMTYSCSRCSATKTEAIPAAGHSYLSVVTPPACTAGGCTTHTCSACGDSYVDSEIPALGHAWDGGAVTVAAACEADGLMTYSCLRCSATKTEAIPATGHSYLSVVTPPACTAGGYTTHTCSVCSNSFIDSETSALGHDWDGGVVTVAAACEADGLMTYSCPHCSAARTEAIPATGHDYVAGAPVPPTYTSEGYTLYTCSHCGISYKSDWVDRLADLIVYFNYTEKAGGYIWPADITSGQSIAGVYQDFNEWEWQESEGVFWLAKWYTDPSREDQYLYDFSEPVTGSFTLYAKWTLKGAPQIVSFNYTEKAGGYIWQAPVPTGQSIAEVYENYNEWEWQDPDGVVWLVKWYTDPGCESQYLYDFDALVTGSFTLYAKWTLK